MSMAPQELENSASKYASDAINADSQGAYGMAISGYQNASATLMKLMRLYPDSKLNQVYTERIRAYQNRVKELQNTCLLYTSPSPRDLSTSRMPSSA